VLNGSLLINTDCTLFEGLSFGIILACRGLGAAGTFDCIAFSISPDEVSNKLVQNYQRQGKFLFIFPLFRKWLWDLTIWSFPVQWTS